MRQSFLWIAPAFALFSVFCGCREAGKQEASTATSAPSAPAATNTPSDTCQREPITSSGVLKIAVVPMGSTHEFWKAIHAGAVKAERELEGVQVLWKGPIKEDDREAQLNVVNNFMDSGVAGMAIAPLDNVAMVRPVRNATHAGIGVVIMDSALDAEVCTDYASFIATDSYLGGCKGARRLGQILNGKGDVILLRCAVGFLSTMTREQGFLDTMAKEFPGIRMISSDQYGGATSESSQNKAESLLQRFQKVDGIFCPNESTTFGTLRALQASGRAGKIKFVGFDSSDKLIAALAAHELHGLVVQDPLNIGYMAVQTLVAYLRGRKVTTRIDTGCEVATPENMHEPRIRELLSPPIDKYL